MNEVLRAIGERSSCRKYTDEPISEDMLNAIAQAALTSPSSMNGQPWRIISVTNKDILSELDAESERILEHHNPAMYQHALSRGNGILYKVPAAIIVAIDPSNMPRTQLDCGIVCQTITLAATSLGLGNVICGMMALAFMGDKAEYFSKALNFPEGYVFGMSVLLGHKAEHKVQHEVDANKLIRIR